ncbi:MAG: hypothetical protein WCA10_26085 [Terracidiphilus sp.]
MLHSARSQRALRVIGLALVLALAIPVFGQAKRALTNDDIIKLVKSGFTDDVIVAMIDANDTAFDVSIGGMTSLKDAGMSSPVMAAMLKAEGKKRQSMGTSPAPAQSPGQPAPVLNPSMPGAGGDYLQQMMSMAMGRGGPGIGSGMSGMLDPNQLPPLFQLTGDTRQPVKPSIAQVASTQTKGDNMPGAGSAATGMLMGLGRQALSFGMVGGSMFAGPGAGIAMGMMGSMGAMGRHHGPPKVTYVWALPGPQSASLVSGSNPRFEMSFGNLLGIDPDAYEPQLIRLVGSKDNWRLVGATKTTQGQIGTEAYEKVTEVRIAAKSERLARGQVQIEPRAPLEPGEYAVVLRAIHPGKRAQGSLGGGAETSIFFSVWDFSVSNDARATKP